MRLATLTLAVASVLTFLVPASNAAVIAFEGFAPAGSLTNVSPGTPYSESGYTFTPINPNSAVFDSAAASTFPGDGTDWFGFASGNTITMAQPTPFSLTSLLIGPSSIGTGNVTATLTGDIFGGGTLTATFTNLTTATTEVLNWNNLADVKFSEVTTDAGIDNISATAVPEPSTLLLLGAGLGTLAFAPAALIRRTTSACWAPTLDTSRASNCSP